MGKKGSYRASRAGRSDTDFYQTPFTITEQLLDVETFRDPILEPCCGRNAITRVLKSSGHDCYGYDLFYGSRRADFLCESHQYPSIVTNPPFRIANEFLLKAFTIATDKIAFFLPLDYLHGSFRHEMIHAVRRPNRIYVLVRRPLLEDMIYSDGKYKTGATTFAWFIYDMTTTGVDYPEIRWIDNSEYVARGSDPKRNQ